VRVALSGGDGEPGEPRRGAGAPADPRAPGVWPQHPAVRRRRPPTARRAGRRAHSKHRRAVRRRDGSRGRRGQGSPRMIPSPAVPLDASPGTQPQAPASLAATRPFYWSVRRELWENRSLYIAPLVVTGLVLFATLLGMFRLPGKMRTLPADPAAAHALVVRPFSLAPAPIMLATFLVGLFYSLDALYGERRDRSLLFWKSLPVSDRTTVLSKASIPLGVLPGIAFALSLVTFFTLLLLSTLVLLGNGISPARLWTEVRFVQEPLV